jgi:hypothetical protein
VIFSLAIAGISVSPPVQATTLCPPGTYVSPYDASICNETPPGTFTDNAGSIQPTLCPPGYHQPYYGQTQCLLPPAGSYNPDTGSAWPVNCDSGSFQANMGSTACVRAPIGKYVSSRGSTAAVDCPATPANATTGGRTGNSSALDCFNFTGNSLVFPQANSTVNNEVNLAFNLGTRLGSDDNLRVTFTGTVSPNPVYQVVARAYGEGIDGKLVNFSMPLSWTNNSYIRGCDISCDSGAPVTSLPLATYNIKVEAKDNTNAWVDLGTVNSVVVSDTITTKPLIYLQAWSYFPLSESATVQVVLPEARSANSAIIKISNQPSYMNPTSTRVYELGSGALDGNIVLPFSGTPTSSDIVFVSGATITPGQWWVSISYEDHRGNPAATDEWQTPLLIAKSCNPGEFSVNGIKDCIGAPKGFQIQYPSIGAFDFDTKAFTPAKCSAGTYQPTIGGTACLPTEAGSYTNVAGSIAAVRCSPGSYQPASGQTSCLLASANHFVSSSGQVSQTPCQSGFNQPSTGSTSCVANPASAVSTTPTAPIVCPALTFSGDGATSTADCKPRPCVVAKGKSATSACLLASVAQVAPAKSKVSIKMSKSFRKTCKVNKTRVRALKKGTCAVTVSVKPRKGKTVKHRVNLVVR